MSPDFHPKDAPESLSREQLAAALFADMVVQQGNMALLCLGKLPHPETGETILDLDSAKMFIEKLEMLAIKTQGNLSRQEENLLKESLSVTRLEFVRAMDAAKSEGWRPPMAPEVASRPAQATAMPPVPPAPVAPPPPPAEKPASPDPGISAPPDSDASESRRRFSKKY